MRNIISVLSIALLVGVTGCAGGGGTSSPAPDTSLQTTASPDTAATNTPAADGSASVAETPAPDVAAVAASTAAEATSLPLPSEPHKYSVKGVIQKGPFVQGTPITLDELDAGLNQTGRTFTTVTTNDTGAFAVNAELVSPFVEIVANGYYFDEVKGSLSSGPLSLRVIADLSSETPVNVNILTTLTRNRIKQLVTDGEAFATASAHAEQDALGAFNISDDSVRGFETMSIADGGERNAALLAVSAIAQGSNTVAQLSEFLAKIDQDIATDGHLDDAGLKQAIVDNSKAMDLVDVRNKLEARYVALQATASIPSFEDYVDSDGDNHLNGADPTTIILNGSMNLEENKNGYLEVSLKGKRPEGNAIVTLASSDVGTVASDETIVTFTPGNFLVPQRVTLHGVQAFGELRNATTVTITASADGLNIPTQAIVFTEGSPIVTNLGFRPGDYCNEYAHAYCQNHVFGQDKKYYVSIRLNDGGLPNNVPVTLTLATDRPDLVSIPQPSITFNNENYQSAQELEISGKYAFGDARNNQPMTFTITSSSIKIHALTKTTTFFDYREPEYIPVQFWAGEQGIGKLAFVSDTLYTTACPSSAGASCYSTQTKIVRLDATGPVLIAGSDYQGSTDGTGGSARFTSLASLASYNGNLYALDSENKIRKITTGGVVTTVMSPSGNSLRQFVMDPNGNFFLITDKLVKKITPTGAITTIAGGGSAEDSADGTGTSATFVNLSQIALDPTGNLYVIDSAHTAPLIRVRKINLATAVVTTPATLSKHGSIASDVSGTLLVLGDDLYGASESLSGSVVYKINSDGTRTRLDYSYIPAIRSGSLILNGEGSIYAGGSCGYACTPARSVYYLQHLGSY